MKAYLRAIDLLAEARGLVSPQLSSMGKTHPYITSILQECKRWEKMPNRREPVTNEMMAYIVATAAKDPNPDSLRNAITDFLVMGEYGGFRKSEWLQDYTDARKGQYARNIDGSAKAFILGDLSFRKNKRIIDDDDPDAIASADMVYVTWRFQKNGNNGESLPFSRNDATPDRCFVRRALSARARARRLNVPTDFPIAVYRDNEGKRRFVSNKEVELVLQEAAIKVHNVTEKKALARWTCHSIRVGACIRLQLLNKPEHFIQTRLRWTSEAWKDYLRNLPELAHAHNDTITALAEELAATH